MNGLKPNDVQACPSAGCRVWHRAHSIEHVCGQDRPSPRRTQSQYRRPGDPVVVHAPWTPRGVA